MAYLPLATKVDGVDYVTAPDVNQLNANTVYLKEQTDLIAADYGEMRIYNTTAPNFVGIPTYMKYCDGELIDDAESLGDGFRMPNMNGANVILTQTWTANAGGATTTLSAANLPAVSVGDWVAGAGIAADSLIIDITGAVVTISDAAATGSIATTFSNDGLYIGGGQSGGSAGDQMQGHYHNFTGVEDGSSPNTGAVTGSRTNLRNYNALNYKGGPTEPITDTVNGEPRTGTRTRPHTRFMKYAMRIK